MPCASRASKRRSTRLARGVEAGGPRHDLPLSDHQALDVQTFAAAVKVPILANSRIRRDAAYTLDELRGADVAIALYPLHGVPFADDKAARDVYERCAARDQRGDRAMQEAPERYDHLATRLRDEARRAVLQEIVMTEVSAARQTEKSVALSRSRRATPRFARWAAPATTSPTAATTSSTIAGDSCEFEEIAHLLVHASCPPHRAASYKMHLNRSRPPEPVRGYSRHSGSCASDGRDATAVSALGTVLPEKDYHNVPARAT